MSAYPVYRVILVVDVEGSSGRTDIEKPLLREAFYGALTAGFARAGLLWKSCQIEDRGDGAYVLLPSTVSKPLLAGRFISAIDGVLAEPRGDGRAWPRLRLSLHAGEVTLDSEGSSGRDVDLAFALVDGDPVRAALRGTSEARCVVVISESFYNALAQGGAGSVPALEGFTPVLIPTKVSDRKAWLRVPGHGGAVISDPVPGAIPDPAAAWRVLVGRPDGPACGWGTLIADRLVLTCAHLVPGGWPAPRGVSVAFGAHGRSGTQRVEVVPEHRKPAWSAAPGAAASLNPQVALLSLSSDPPFGIRAAPLARLGHPAPGRRLVVAGPNPQPVEIVGADDPTGARIRLRYLEFASSRCAADYWSLGLSGAPVTDGRTGEMVGLVIDHEAGWPGTNEVIMVSVEAALGTSSLGDAAWHGLVGDAETASSADTANGPAVSLLEFALALSELSVLANVADRNQVVETLRDSQPDAAGTVRRLPDRRSDVLSIVRTCDQYQSGLDDLLAIVRHLEGNSRRMGAIMALRSRMRR